MRIKMSGAEVDPGFTWTFSIGSLATIITIVASVIGGAVAFIRFIRKDVRDAILASTDKIDNLDVKITAQEQVTRDELKRNVERITEIKWMMQEVTKRVDETKHDANKRVDERIADIRDMTRKLELLREELYGLKLDVVRKIERSQTLTSGAQESMQKIFDEAEQQQKKTMETIGKRLTEAEEEVREQKDDHE